MPPLGFGAVILRHSTLADNAARRGSGIFNHSNGDMTGSIITDNWPAGGDCWGYIDSKGYNLDGDGTCRLGAPTDQPAAEADLLGLAVHAPGKTATYALGAASAARDRIPAGGPGCDAAATDQRGVPRPQPAGGLCDTGAFEAQVGE